MLPENAVERGGEGWGVDERELRSCLKGGLRCTSKWSDNPLRPGRICPGFHLDGLAQVFAYNVKRREMKYLTNFETP